LQAALVDEHWGHLVVQRYEHAVPGQVMNNAALSGVRTIFDADLIPWPVVARTTVSHCHLART
jgi:hypothetical protein